MRARGLTRWLARWLVRVSSPLHSLWTQATAAPLATRVGLLNTGELVLVDSLGHAQILGAQTTDVVRDILDAAECNTSSLVRPAAPDHVHSAIQSLRTAP